jgi:hypothetical protein
MRFAFIMCSRTIARFSLEEKALDEVQQNTRLA